MAWAVPIGAPAPVLTRRSSAPARLGADSISIRCQGGDEQDLLEQARAHPRAFAHLSVVYVDRGVRLRPAPDPLLGGPLPLFRRTYFA
jgi:hypothetical protein